MMKLPFDYKRLNSAVRAITMVVFPFSALPFHTLVSHPQRNDDPNHLLAGKSIRGERERKTRATENFSFFP